MTPELLLPAGSRETLETAIRYGADAVYLGAKALSLRAKATNFSLEELADAVALAHDQGVRAYLTANIFARDADLEEAEAFFKELSLFPERSCPDAVLISDPGMLGVVRKHLPKIPLHLSTQANTTNAASCRFWHDAGFSRIVLARELSVDEIAGIRRKTPETLSLECFVHGAMCISYSGRCLLSRALTGREANRGACAHPCRYNYVLSEEKRPGEYFPIEEDAYGTEILASEDLCMIAHLPELIDAGVGCFKVEGRMKNALYVAAVARAYRRALDLLLKTPSQEAAALYRQELPKLLSQIQTVATRPMATGFFLEHRETYDQGAEPHTFLGVVREVFPDGSFMLLQRNRFSVGDTIRVMKPYGDLFARVTSITVSGGASVEHAVHPREELTVSCRPENTEGDPFIESGDILFL